MQIPSFLNSTVNAPVINSHPKSQLLIVPGESVSFTVNATGYSNTLDSLKYNLMYQWQKDGNNIPGADSNVYTISSVAESDEGEYQCVVSNFAGTVISDPASLTLCKLVVDSL